MVENQTGRARPARSVADIVKEAQDFDHAASSTYPIRIVLRTAQNILNQATNYERDGDLEQAYLFFYRHAEFCITRLTTHPDRKKPEWKAAVARATKQVDDDLAHLEKIKPKLDERYKIYKASKPAKSPISQFVDADQSYDVARKLDRERHKLRRRSRDQDRSRRSSRDEDRDLSRLLRNLEPFLTGKKPQSEEPYQTSPRRDRFANTQVPQRHKDKAPPVPDKLELDQRRTSASSTSWSAATPPKTPTSNAPPVPMKEHDVENPHDDIGAKYTFKALTTTEGGKPLRPMFLPAEVQAFFLSAAQANTALNLETCGILCATLMSGALFVSHVIIPQQTSTSDTCDTTEAGDAALFDYVDSKSLLVCGWIHTHPSQTCFLSSRDLHTSLGYQVMLPESIAIVCAPKHEPKYGCFRITDPPGVQVISACSQQGLFHPHEQGELYTHATRPGHVSELEGLHFELVDLRGV